MIPKIKICGITNLADARAAIDCGAAYLGFIFAEKSPRFVKPEVVKDIVARLPNPIQTVGVFVDCPPMEVVRILMACNLDIAQLCGHETSHVVDTIGVQRVWKAWHLVSDDDVEKAAAFPAAAILADTMLPGQRGGTGKVCDWTLAKRLRERRRIVLAGGITAANIADAIVTVNPAVIDIGSGVEAEPGRKDRAKLETLFGVIKQ